MKNISLFVFIMLLLSCSKQPSNLERALIFAGENRSELEKVLSHYKKDAENNLKHKAAVFLIENMPYHFYYEGELLEQYSHIYEAMMRIQEANVVIDSFSSRYGHFSSHSLTRKEDIKYIKSDYLISNIDFAFKTWKEQPWGKSISFNDFCMYVLPYRVNVEQPLEWRQYLYEKYNPVLDSLRKTGDALDPLAAAQVIINYLCKEEKFFTAQMDNIPLKTPLLIDKHRAASCRNMADLTVYILRALGIPCGIDYLPLHGRINAGHNWTFILDKEGNSFTSDYLDCSVIPASESLHFAAKIYRETFNVNNEIKNDISKFKSSPAPFLRNPRFIDVTESYCKEDPRTISISDTNCYHSINKDNIVYLCGSYFRDWRPVDHAKIESDKITFKIKPDYYSAHDTLMNGLTKESFNLLPDPAKDYIETMVFRLANWNNNKLEYLTDPFIIKENGTIEFIRPDEKEKSTVCVFSKFNHLSDGFVQYMPGSTFEASNDKNFENVDTLFQIKDIPFRLLNTQHISTNKKFRYIRYKGSDNSYCGISEIKIHGSSELDALKGRPFGYIIGDEVKNHTFDKAFDGNTYTSFYSSNPSGSWVGFDLGKPHSISKIIFTPRNRDNFIRINDMYEMFYLKGNTWNSLGTQVAKSDSLIFESVPLNSLLYLKNHTRGNEERTFIYKNNVQIFL